MRIPFKRLRECKRGTIMVLAAAAMPLIVGFAGLATDTIQWTLWKRELQRAADSAAMAGVYERNGGASEDEAVTAVDHDLTLNQKTGIALLNDPDVAFPADSGDMTNQVRVTLAVQKRLPFSSLFMDEAPVIEATATAASVPGSDEYCVVSLENTNRAGIIIGGNANIEMDCGMISNSPAANSALSNGTASSVRASVIAAVGDVQESTRWDVDKYDPYVTPIDDPYANVNIDRSQMDCFNVAGRYPLLGTSTSNNFNGANATVDLAAARALNANANCFRGLTVPTGTTLTLDPGTYYVGQGGLNVQGTLAGTGVTIVLTNDVGATGTSVGQIDVNASASMNITAPDDDSNPYNGIAIYQDRAASDSAQTNKINGNATNNIIGAVYFPKQEIVYNGTGTSTFMCTRLVGRRVTFSGNSSISNKFAAAAACPNAGPPIEGGRRVRLVA
jgi:Flp pilus assembly protein TadG